MTIDAVGLTYDALGRMAEQNRSGAYTQIVYAPTGEKLALMSASTLQQAFIPLPGNAQAVYTSSGLSYYRHADWLGSSRFASTPTPPTGMYSDTAYAPIGEPYAQAGATDLSFTGQNQDTVAGGLAGPYDFPAREYGPQGRWASPDPAGLAAVDPTNPQSWNRYAYVLNNPLSYIDPTGLNQASSDCIWNGDCLGLFGPGGGAGAGYYGGGPGGCSLDGVQVGCGGLSGLGSNGITPVITGPNGVIFLQDASGEWINASASEELSPESVAEIGALNLGDPFDSYPFPNSTGQGSSSGGSGCTARILSAVNQTFGTSFTAANVQGLPFGNGGAINLNILGNGLPAAQFNSIQTGRYPLSPLTWLIGYGPTLHIAGPGIFDPTAVFSNSNVGGATSVLFTAHIDTSFAYNPIGAVIHLVRDLLHTGGSRNPCP